MARKRFTPAEREAFTLGAVVEWRNGAHWHAAEVAGSLETDSLGKSYIPLIHRGRTTSTVSYGNTVRGYPTSVRVS